MCGGKARDDDNSDKQQNRDDPRGEIPGDKGEVAGADHAAGRHLGQLREEGRAWPKGTSGKPPVPGMAAGDALRGAVLGAPGVRR